MRWFAAGHLHGYILVMIAIGRVNEEPPIIASATSAVWRGKAPNYGPSIEPPRQMWFIYTYNASPSSCSSDCYAHLQLFPRGGSCFNMMTIGSALILLPLLTGARAAAVLPSGGYVSKIEM